MTQLLYLKDNYSIAFESTVKFVDFENGYIVLQNTLFHPKGGHQVFDTGMIEQGNVLLDVIEVKNSNDEVRHYVSKKDNLSLVNTKEPVKGKINWERRYQLMKTHTAQHLFSAVAKKLFNLESIDMTIEESHCSIKFDKAFESGQILDVQNESNKLIRENLKVTRLCSNDVYMVNIGGVDSRNCGCTHIMELQEIGQIYVYKTSSNRVFFKVGSSAGCEQAKDHLEILKIQAVNNLSLTELSAGYMQLVEREKGLARELTSIGKDLLNGELNQKNKIYDSTNENLIVIKRPELDIKTVTTIMNKYLEITYRAVVVICKNDTALIFSNIEGIPANNITEMFKYNEPNFRGGGNNKFSQGGVWKRSIQETYDLIESALLEVTAYCD